MAEKTSEYLKVEIKKNTIVHSIDETISFVVEMDTSGYTMSITLN